MAGTAGTFTSCKDYDDDIKDLQGQLDKKASLDELNSKVSTLETSIAEAKTEASNAKTAAQEALDKAKEALDKAGQGGASSEDIAALKKALEDADAALQKQIDKLASLDAVDKKIADLKAELHKISGITSKNGRNDAKRLNIRVVTVSNDDKPKNRKTQRKADLRRRMVCKSLPVKE